MAAPGLIKVRATITFVPTEKGGRTGPAKSGYRPNHNFGAPTDTLMQIGKVEFEGRQEVFPGETATALVTFLGNPDLAAQVHIGREWRLQEGLRLVANAKVTEVFREP
jgi:translation elongation factor EF-Tu-like GTPase